MSLTQYPVAASAFLGVIYLNNTSTVCVTVLEVKLMKDRRVDCRGGGGGLGGGRG